MQKKPLVSVDQKGILLSADGVPPCYFRARNVRANLET